MKRSAKTSFVNLRHGFVARNSPAVTVKVFSPADHYNAEHTFDLTPEEALRLARRLVIAAQRASAKETP